MSQVSKIPLDVVVECPKNEIDMQYGLDTLKGTSDTMSIAAEAILRGRVPEKRTHKSDVRSILKNRFTGSYGVNFTLEVRDSFLRRRLRQIGSDTFLEVLTYFIMEALYLDSEELSKPASELVESLEGISDKLVERLKEPLTEMHKMNKYFGHDLRIGSKKKNNQKELFRLNETTSRNICESIKTQDDEEFEVVIVRFHSITGNGRFYIKSLKVIESFGFDSEIQGVRDQIRKAISKNLHENNTLQPEDGTFMRIKAKKIALPAGKVIKYLITGIYL
ncbi:hypothetical protein [Pseudoalteromonas obscura]|uniref:Uncharacterized protein n=1 Tax=Pseudoalteromonas obscura TaxID=3048491 RepID=A0ABT7EGT3_9GAMM|nr:hypothetical protein [Pseudoalteromonas sp. P94(2023)]MDK2594233.1 hypothetical protein [Pseudoalteromonas sp. P94(2023)]